MMNSITAPGVLVFLLLFAAAAHSSEELLAVVMAEQEAFKDGDCDKVESMLAEDVPPNRMERAKTELGSFLDRLEDSRVGLVYFAGSAFVQCPLTLDHPVLKGFLDLMERITPKKSF